MTTPTHESALSALLHENRRFPPPAEFAAAGQRQGRPVRGGGGRPGGVLGASRRDRLTWDTRWNQVLDWSDAPFAKWFVGGTLNVAVNCVDRHVDAGNGDKVAFYWEGEPEGDTRVITYADLQREVNKTANALTELGVGTGDRVAIYMPMIPETVVHDAGLRPPGRAAHRGLRRLLRRGAVQPHPRLRLQARRHRRRRLPARAAPQPSSPTSTRRSSRAPASRRCWSCAAPARTSPGTTAATSGGTTSSSGRATSTPREAARRRAPALHHVHLRHDGEAEGHPAHHRRLPHPRRLHPLQRSSTSSRRPTSTGAPPTSAGSPATPTSCTGRWPTAPRR